MAPYPYQYQPCARPFIAYLTDSRRPVNQRAHDCITIHIVRSGSVILTSGDLQKPIRVGDVTLIAPLTLTGYVPEGEAGITTLLIDTDYLIEHLFWQHLAVIPDRDAARDLAARLYPDPAQVLRLGEPEIERLGPILDELVTLSDVTQNAAGYFRAQALLFAVLEAISPHVRSTPVAVPPLTSHQRVKRVAPPRWRAYRPVRREAALAAALMQSDIAKPWRLAELATRAHLSPHQFANVFVDSFGVTPYTYLSILRVQRMAKLVRETDQPITQLYRKVGWRSRGHAATIFRSYLGVNPSEYRRYGPPTVSRDGPGIGVARVVHAAEPKVRYGDDNHVSCANSCATDRAGS